MVEIARPRLRELVKKPFSEHLQSNQNLDDKDKRAINRVSIVSGIATAAALSYVATPLIGIPAGIAVAVGERRMVPVLLTIEERASVHGKDALHRASELIKSVGRRKASRKEQTGRAMTEIVNRKSWQVA